MEKVIKLLMEHRSIRRFTDQEIPEDVLQSLIEAGQMASTSSYIQAVSVIRVVDVSNRSAFTELAGNQKYVATAAEFLVFCADLNRNDTRASRTTQDSLDYAWTEQFIAATVDVSLFAQNVVIAAESMGLGCCYIGGIRNDPDRVTELLNLPQLVYPVFGLCIGYPAQQPEIRPRLPLQTVLHQDRYSGAQDWQAELDIYDTVVKQYLIARSKGKLDATWSVQMAKQSLSQTRSFMKKYLEKQGLAIK